MVLPCYPAYFQHAGVPDAHKPLKIDNKILYLVPNSQDQAPKFTNFSTYMTSPRLGLIVKDEPSELSPSVS